MNYRTSPIYKHRRKIINALKRHQVIIVESPTGTGKSTCIPLILHEKGMTKDGIIGITQPRRIATVSLCEFIAKQLNESIPNTVGYKMRFNDRTNNKTRIKIMTDGTLLQELKTDHMLSSYSVIMIDEAHERSLTIDFILGILKRLLLVRKDLRVIISSATINTTTFSHYFNHCPIISIDAKSYPVAIYYNKDNPYQGATSQNVLIEKQIIKIVHSCISTKQYKDILIFLQGEHNIKQVSLALQQQPWHKALTIRPLYSRLSKEEQESAVFDPANKGTIKVVLATNIAETSLTIDNIATVIDSGLSKINRYNAHSHTFALKEFPIPKAAADQRAGRAGRQMPGICYRLYSEKDLNARERFATAEIMRTDLSEVILRLAELGIKDFEDFDFIAQPHKNDITAAINTLIMLDALTEDHSLTKIGIRMLDFPVVPRQSRIIMEAILRYPDVLTEVLIVVSFLTSQFPYLLPMNEEAEARRAHRSFKDDRGDYHSLIALFNEYTDATDQEKFCNNYYLDHRIMREISNARQQLEDICIDMGVVIGHGGSSKQLHCALGKGLIDSICIQVRGDKYRTLSATDIFIHPGSVFFGTKPRLFVASEIVSTTKTYARTAGIMQEQWLKNLYPEAKKIMNLLKSTKNTDSRQNKTASNKEPHTQNKQNNARKKRRPRSSSSFKPSN